MSWHEQGVAWTGYAWAAGATGVCTLAGWAMHPRFDLVNIAMVYLLAVVIVALRFSRGPAIATSVLCVAAFDFCSYRRAAGSPSTTFSTC